MWILEAITIKEVRMKEKDKYQGDTNWKILGAIFKLDKRTTQTNEPEDKKVDDDAKGLKS